MIKNKMNVNASSFIGYYVSLTCENNSIYEGEVGDIDVARQLITLTHAHQLLPGGGVAKFPQVTLTGSHVTNLKIIREKINVIPFTKEEKEKVKAGPEKCNSTSLKKERVHDNGGNSEIFPNKSKKKEHCFNTQTDKMGEQKNKMKMEQLSFDSFNSTTYSNVNSCSNTDNFSAFSNNTHRKKNLCFSAEADKLARYPDFDFEENLAKFDKQAVFEKMSAGRDRGSSISYCNKKMSPQENVLESVPVSLRQIKVSPEHAGKEYTTDDGFIVPAITLALKLRLFAASEKAGLSLQQLVENAGICTCQMALQLVGGSLRINPKNDHQRPEIVVLAGSHTQGLQAVSAARHLVNHTARVVLYLPESTFIMQSQVDLFLKSGGKLIKTYKDLPTQPVDMIIDAMFGMDLKQHNLDWLPYAVSWANQNKAPLLAVDPCLPEWKSEVPEIKWSIAMALPLIRSPKVGRLYLADVGIPRDVFKDVGIQYMSPFTDKFYIPLHDC